MTSVDPRSEITRQDKADGAAKELCAHHWRVSPPTYSRDGLVETTYWTCRKCKAHRVNRLVFIPFKDNDAAIL